MSICPNSDVDNRAKTKMFLSLNNRVVFTATRVKLIVRLCIDICLYSGRDEKMGKLMVAERSSLRNSLHSCNLEEDLLPSAQIIIPFLMSTKPLFPSQVLPSLLHSSDHLADLSF